MTNNLPKVAGSNQGSQENELTFVELVRVLARYRFMILGFSFGSLLIALATAFVITPIYRAESTIAPANETVQSGGGGLANIVSRLGNVPGLSAMGMLGQRDATGQAVVTLTSQKFTRDFIQDENLLPILFKDSWDSDKNEWNVVNADDVPTLEDGYELFDKKVREIVEEDFGIVRVAIEWEDRELAAEWANKLIGRLNDRLRKQAIDEANSTIEYLNRELEKTKIVELQQAIYFMIENQINARTMANIREEYAFKVISPAIPPDEDKFVRPNRLLIAVFGLIIGLIVGIFTSFLLFAIARVRASLSSPA